MHGTTPGPPGAASPRTAWTVREPARHRAARRRARGANALHCLVVEDNPTNQLVITLFLRKLGVTHDLVERGAEALAALADRRFDLVLMDIEMPISTATPPPGSCGGARRRRAAPAHRSSRSRPTRCPRAAAGRARRGMDDFLTKPIAMDALRPRAPHLRRRPRGRMAGA